jgi:hypothetical protein
MSKGIVGRLSIQTKTLGLLREGAVADQREPRADIAAGKMQLQWPRARRRVSPEKILRHPFT